MAAPLLLRGLPLLRLQHQRLAVAVNLLTRRPWSTSAELTQPDENLSCAVNTLVPSAKEPPSYPRIDDPDFRKWKDKEEEILKDIEPIALLVKEILHSRRYIDGEILTTEDEKIVVEKLLAYHPHSEDKIGCGLNSIMSEKKQMVAPSLLRGLPRLRLRLRLQHQSLAVAVNLLTRRPCSTSAELTRPDENLSSAVNTSVPSSKEPPSYPRIDDPDFTKWKDKKEEILKDIEPIALLVKEILHSQRYFDGETLTAEDEKIVVEKLLPYHPHSEDKIGCGLDSIMVDRHTQFRQSRCLFVIRVDGGWIDFSYRKCLRAYVRQKYPSYAEKFILEHYKCSS